MKTHHTSPHPGMITLVPSRSPYAGTFFPTVHLRQLLFAPVYPMYIYVCVYLRLHMYISISTSVKAYFLINNYNLYMPPYLQCF